jgi:hypothetical protein
MEDTPSDYGDTGRFIVSAIVQALALAKESDPLILLDSREQ